MQSIIKDIKLAPLGHQRIAWAKEYMPLLNHLNDEYSKTKPFQGINMVVTIHLEAKTAYLALVLKNTGANVVVTGSNPLSTQTKLPQHWLTAALPFSQPMAAPTKNMIRICARL